MIVSFSRKFIFIKTRKVAGTSVELFLSQFCGDEDILTVAGAADQKKTRVNARNADLPGYGKGRMLKRFGKLIGRPAFGHGGFYNHMPAKEIRRLIGEEIWNSFFKFSIERNPWDRQVSLYHWHYRQKAEKPSFDRFVSSPFLRKTSPNFDTYAIDGEIAVDQVCRYENLAGDLQTVLKRIGLDAEVELPRAKAGFRSKTKNWRDYYTPRTRGIVGRLYAREIDAFDYRF